MIFLKLIFATLRVNYESADKKIFEELNSAQKGVNHIDGPSLIVAGRIRQTRYLPAG